MLKVIVYSSGEMTVTTQHCSLVTSCLLSAINGHSEREMKLHQCEITWALSQAQEEALGRS